MDIVFNCNCYNCHEAREDNSIYCDDHQWLQEDLDRRVERGEMRYNKAEGLYEHVEVTK